MNKSFNVHITRDTSLTMSFSDIVAATPYEAADIAAARSVNDAHHVYSACITATVEAPSGDRDLEIDLSHDPNLSAAPILLMALDAIRAGDSERAIDVLVNALGAINQSLEAL